MPDVLLADDDEELLSMYELWLGDLEGVSLRTATDGSEAIDRLDDAVDVAVLDRRMPNTPGAEVAQTTRSHFPECTVVIASAFRPDDGIPAEHYDHYLTKPISKDDLIEVIETSASSSIPTSQ